MGVAEASRPHGQNAGGSCNAVPAPQPEAEQACAWLWLARCAGASDGCARILRGWNVELSGRNAPARASPRSQAVGLSLDIGQLHAAACAFASIVAVIVQKVDTAQ